MSDELKCAQCGCLLDSSDEETSRAKLEAKERYGEEPTPDKYAPVCPECHIKIMSKYN